MWFVPIRQNSVAEASFFLGVRERIVERYISKFLSKGHVKPEPVSRSHGSISFAQREELIVFAAGFFCRSQVTGHRSLFY